MYHERINPIRRYLDIQQKEACLFSIYIDEGEKIYKTRELTECQWLRIFGRLNKPHNQYILNENISAFNENLLLT